MISKINIGYVGEKRFRRALIDTSDLMSAIAANYTVTIMHKRHGDNDSYPVGSVTVEGSSVIWEFDAIDTAIAGYGEARVMLIADGGEIVGISKPIQTYVGRGVSEGETPPEGSTWVTEIIGRVSALVSEAESHSHDAIVNAESARESASKAEEKATQIMSVSEAVDRVLAAYENGELNGVDGDDGFSPTVSTVPISNGYRITITDKNGTHSVDIVNGRNGSDVDVTFNSIVTALGYTPLSNASILAHNMSSDSHNDIRLLISDIARRLNTIANSDDVSLDQLSEIVAYIKNNRQLIESITTGKINVGDIINDLVSDVADMPLSAAMGVELKRMCELKADKDELTGKQDIIHDLDTIREGAAKGETALQTVPIATAYTAGGIRVGTGLWMRQSDGMLFTNPANTGNINARSAFEPITPANIDYAVKSALTDGKGADYAVSEQEAGRKRLGAYRPNEGWELKGVITTESKAAGAHLDLTGCTEILIHATGTATGGCNLCCNVSVGNLVYDFFKEGLTITRICRFESDSVGINPVQNRWGTSSATNTNNDTANAYYLFDCQVSDIARIYLAPHANVTSCDIKIYAR